MSILEGKDDMGGWLPIESAPKDGTSFLACVGQWMTVCYWNRHRHDWRCVCSYRSEYADDERPQYWQRLPIPPLSSEAAS